jgi:hypothetical protein
MPVCLDLCLSWWLSSLNVYLSWCLSFFMSVCLDLCICWCLSLLMSICPDVCLSWCIHTCIHTYIHTHTQECGSSCKCGAEACKTRITLRSGLGPLRTVLYPVFVMHVDDLAGFGLFNGCESIPKGSLVMEYIGQCVCVCVWVNMYVYMCMHMCVRMRYQRSSILKDSFVMVCVCVCVCANVNLCACACGLRVTAGEFWWTALTRYTQTYICIMPAHTYVHTYKSTHETDVLHEKAKLKGNYTFKTYIHTHTYTCMHTHIHTHIHKYTQQMK